MGISGLLPLLRSITRRTHLQELAGKVVAVDAYSWLHKGIYGSCAVDLFHGRSNLSLRLTSRMKANEFLAVGNSQAAFLHIQRATDITTKMAASLMDELRRHRIEFVVAPYEADAQMAWLDRMDRVAAVITEDSDLLLFGCKRVLFKLDKDGYADEIRIEKLGDMSELNMSSFTFEKFRQMCMLSGCDYLPSIHGMGLKTAHRYLCKYHNITRVLQVMRAEMPSKMPKDYEADFVKAELTFIHQRVYDVDGQRVCFLNPLPSHVAFDEVDGWDFLGPPIGDDAVAKGICEGHLCPNTMEPFASTPIIEQPPLVVDELMAPGADPLAAALPFEVLLDKKTVRTSIMTTNRITMRRPLDIESRKENVLPVMVRSKKFAFSSDTISDRIFASIPKYLQTKSKVRKAERRQRSIRDYFQLLSPL